MKGRRWGFWVLCWGMAWGVTGCISSHQTINDDTPRRMVDFENEAAGRLFYEGLSRMTRPEESESRTEVNIPVILEVSKTKRKSSNAVFNEAVVLCDTNQDARITELEAHIFSENVGSF